MGSRRVEAPPTLSRLATRPASPMDCLVVNLIKIDDHPAFEIRLLTKRHVHKTEGVIVHGF